MFSTSREGLLAGANACAVRGGSGEWEVVQFEEAEEIAPGRFRLRRLLRAQGGTEEAMAGGAAAGSAFVLLDGSTSPLPIAAGEIGAALNWRIAPAGRAPDNGAVHAEAAALGLRALRPLSPVHLKARFEAGGGVRLSWIRRTREGGDRWEGIEVPLGEEIERYRVTVRGDGGPTIAFETDAPTLTLGAEAQVAGFGAMPRTLLVAVSQVSLAAGPGSVRTALFHRAA